MGSHISILEIRNLPFECDAVLSILGLGICL